MSLGLCCSGGASYIVTLPPYSEMFGPIPPHGLSNRDRVRPSEIRLYESLPPAANPADLRRSFWMLAERTAPLAAVRTAVLQVPPPEAAGLMDPGFVCVDP